MSTRTTQAQAESPIQRVVDHIVAERFTGVLRVRAREADGELWFLAGIEEDARFGMSKGKEAVERLMRATDPVFEAEQRFPGLTGGFKKALSPTGSFAEVQPVDLMRYCEMFALTCVLDLVGKEQRVRLTYRTGELLSADTASGGDEVLASLLESQEGTYQFELPVFDLPSGVNRPRISLRPGAPPGMVTAPAGAAKTSLADRVDLSLASDGGRGDSVRPDSTAEARSKAEAQAEPQRQADARPRYEDERQVDARRRAQEREAEARRRAQEEREAEEARLAAEEREADERRQAEEREADERRAEEERVEAERRRADEEREAEARRAEERRADAKRTSEPKREAQRPREVGKRPSAAATPRGRPTPVPPPRTLQWLWLLLALAAIVVANYFLRKIH